MFDANRGIHILIKIIFVFNVPCSLCSCKCKYPNVSVFTTKGASTRGHVIFMSLIYDDIYAYENKDIQKGVMSLTNIVVDYFYSNGDIHKGVKPHTNIMVDYSYEKRGIEKRIPHTNISDIDNEVMSPTNVLIDYVDANEIT